MVLEAGRSVDEAGIAKDRGQLVADALLALDAVGQFGVEGAEHALRALDGVTHGGDGGQRHPEVHQPADS